MSLRVAIGPAEISGTGTALAVGLRALGVDAELAFWKPLPGAFPSDRALGRTARILYGLAAPVRRDVLHYQYGSTWVPGWLDARLARGLRRTVVATYHGDDCRLAETASGLGWPLAPFKDAARDGAIRRRVRRLAGLCDAAIVMDLEVASYLRQAFRRIYVAPIPLHTLDAELAPLERPPGPVVVLHAPSDERVKGSAAVRAAAEAVARRIPLELVTLSGVPHNVIAEHLARTDVVVDQMHSVSASVLTLEAMRAGLPVLTHLDRRGLAPFHASMPAVHVTASTLERELEALARDRPRRLQLGAQGRDYVARYHAAEQAARAVLHVYARARSDPPGLYEVTAAGVRRLDDAILPA